VDETSAQRLGGNGAEGTDANANESEAGYAWSPATFLTEDNWVGDEAEVKYSIKNGDPTLMSARALATRI
jgi:hypothetical protein